MTFIIGYILSIHTYCIAGDPGGHFRRALKSFPNQEIAQRALDKYFIEGGKSPTKPYRSLPLWTMTPARALEEATILGNYCEVWLAKHNDDGRLVPDLKQGILHTLIRHSLCIDLSLVQLVAWLVSTD